MGWITSEASGLEKVEKFHHVKLVGGKCHACERRFSVTFTKKTPHEAFTPVTFTCSCSAFTYNPEDETVSVKDTGLSPAELRERADRIHAISLGEVIRQHL
ncbi:MAG TPA: hypothetical protein VD862_03205 [Candidatus Paceibacterota bacterium]|nr:hypothetical protein [Candidatus Paceibacterota bacterium]